MGLREALDDAQASTGRAPTCRVCVLIDTLPEPDASDLAAAARPGSGVGIKAIADALAKEGHPGMYQSLKHHIYLHGADR